MGYWMLHLMLLTSLLILDVALDVFNKFISSMFLHLCSFI